MTPYEEALENFNAWLVSKNRPQVSQFPDVEGPHVSGHYFEAIDFRKPPASPSLHWKCRECSYSVLVFLDSQIISPLMPYDPARTYKPGDLPDCKEHLVWRILDS